MTQASAPTWAAVRGVSHLAMNVADLERSIAFYTQALGLDIFHDERDSAETPNIKGLVGDFAIELQQNAAQSGRIVAPADAAPSGTQCVSFTVTDVEAAFARFREAGFARSDAILEISGVKMFFAVDPDGYVFELIEFPQGLRNLGDLAPFLRRSAAQ